MTSIYGVSKERIEYGKAVSNCSNFGFGFWSFWSSLLKPNCQITVESLMIEACRIGIAHRAAGPSGAGERENEQQDGNQRPSIEPIPATFARCCQLIVTNRWLRPPRDQANCSSRSEGLPECNERGWATDVTRCAHPVLEG